MTDNERLAIFLKGRLRNMEEHAAGEYSDEDLDAGLYFLVSYIIGYHLPDSPEKRAWIAIEEARAATPEARAIVQAAQD